jgi:hypothetical protein
VPRMRNRRARDPSHRPPERRISKRWDGGRQLKPKGSTIYRLDPFIHTLTTRD